MAGCGLTVDVRVAAEIRERDAYGFPSLFC